MEARDFSVFCPKVLAGIDTGRLPETIQDRAVTLRMKRRRHGENVERLRYRIAHTETEPLRAELAAWAASTIDRLRDAVPELPDELGDRAADAWEPLLAIADLAKGDWPTRARAAAVELSAGESEEVGRGTQLLAAIREAMGGRADRRARRRPAFRPRSAQGGAVAHRRAGSRAFGDQHESALHAGLPPTLQRAPAGTVEAWRAAWERRDTTRQEQALTVLVRPGGERLPDRACESCGVEIAADRHGNTRFCSDGCRRHATYLRERTAA
jgi:hypothetical protein